MKEEIQFISRAPEFSPNNIAKDRAIFDKVQETLTSFGVSSQRLSEQEIESLNTNQRPLAIVTMCRRLKTLIWIERSGIPSYNSARGIINTATSRELTLSLLRGAGVRIPNYWTYEPEEDEMFQCDKRLAAMLPVWVKAMRHDGVKEGDVLFAETTLAADSVVLRFLSENVQDIVATSHVHGDLVKVYAVTDRQGEINFLRWFYPQELKYTKFGEDAHNDELQYFQFDENTLRTTVKDIARALEIQFFGIDIIVGSAGEMTVIDVNDWPSYSICQDEAAEAIARTILADIETYRY